MAGHLAIFITGALVAAVGVTIMMRDYFTGRKRKVNVGGVPHDPGDLSPAIRDLSEEHCQVIPGAEGERSFHPVHAFFTRNRTFYSIPARKPAILVQP
jgi:hypothetical protein